MENMLCNGVRKQQKAGLLYEGGTNQDLWPQHRQSPHWKGQKNVEETGSW